MFSEFVFSYRGFGLLALQKEEAIQAAAAAEVAAAQARADAAKPVSSSVWGSSSPSKAVSSLRDIQAQEFAANVDDGEDAEEELPMMELGDALKHMLGVPTAKPKAPQPASSPVWGTKEATPKAKSKPTKSLREIQEEEARLEAEQAAAKAAALAAAASTGQSAVPLGAWARAASKNVAVPLAEPIMSLRSIQAEEQAGAAPSPVLVTAAPASAPVVAGVWASKVRQPKPNLVGEPKATEYVFLVWEHACLSICCLLCRCRCCCCCVQFQHE